MNNKSPRPWEIWHVKFNFSEKKGYKYRPVIIINVTKDDSLVMMVTSSNNKLPLKHDYLIVDWKYAGLDKPSIARADRIIQVPADYIGNVGRIGHLSETDIRALTEILVELTKD